MCSNHFLEEGLLSFFSQIIQEFVGLMHENNLSMPQIYVLMYLYHEGESQISDIARLMDASTPAASQLIERLWQQKLVEREEDPGNRRIKKVHLSEKGQALVIQGIISNRFFTRLFSHLDARQIDTIHTALGYLAGAMRVIREEESSGGDA